MESRKSGVAVLSRILAQLQKGDVHIPAVPTVVTELRALVAKSDSKIDAVISLIERDASLLAKVLQLGRSASIARNAPSPDLRHIISRVGFRQVSDIVETVWANNCFKIADPRYAPIAAQLSRHSVARAVAARALAQVLSLDAFPAYLAGLFADVGASFLLWAIVDKSRGHAPDPEDALAFVREHHEAMGGAVLKRWGHTDFVIGLVRRHHTPAFSSPSSAYSCLLVIASRMAAELTGEDDLTLAPPWPPAALVERCTSHAGVTEDMQISIMARLREEFASALTGLD